MFRFLNKHVIEIIFWITLVSAFILTFALLLSQPPIEWDVECNNGLLNRYEANARDGEVWVMGYDSFKFVDSLTGKDVIISGDCIVKAKHIIEYGEP